MSKAIGKGRYVHLYPEGELITKDSSIREFKKGAFQLAVENHVPIVPIRIRFIEKKHKFSYPFFVKDRIQIEVLKPQYPNIFMLKKESTNELTERAFNLMNQTDKTQESD